MTEYIERDAAVKIAEKYGTCNGSVLGRHSGIADIIASRIDAIPAADVVPVVRCRDCEHSYDDIVGRICAYGPCVDCVVADDFYCKNGKRGDKNDQEWTAWRCEVLMGVEPFAQPYRDYDGGEPTDEQRRLARWVNMRAAFASRPV